jgi:glutamate synthase (ferredoxin)
MTGKDVAIAALLGAEEFGFATAPLIALGCVMMRFCNLDTCPAGIATQNPRLRERFSGKPEYVENFMRYVAQELREHMAFLGFRSVREMVGRSEMLEMVPSPSNPKTRQLDYAKILYKPKVLEKWSYDENSKNEHDLEHTLDKRVLLRLCEPAVESGRKLSFTLPIRNVDRVVGTILGSEITKRYGSRGLPEDTIKLRFVGSAGQSFGAFLPSGITLTLEGDANDHIGKGLSGGKIIVLPPRIATFSPEENIIIGNVALYGATKGSAFIQGQAGERFCVRNSGALAVVEGVGDHACEYMTAGRVVILGKTGKNFGAGMSGGIAYVYDADGNFPLRCNPAMVDIDDLSDGEREEELLALLNAHVEATGSAFGRELLKGWAGARKRFAVVFPKDYRRMKLALGKFTQSGMSQEEALMAAFEENNRDLARVAGN